MAIDWENFLDPYIQAVGELKIKLRGIRKQYRKQQKHSPIEFVTGRVKPIESILEKMERRSISEENLAQDMRVVQERDYIRHKKSSGYRSYHVVVEYPVDTINGYETILAEIQIRTLSMNFWATIEHSLNYKYKGDFPDEIKKRLEVTANLAYQLDEEMGAIRDAIQEAQALFDPMHRKLNDGVGNSDDTDEDYR